MTRILIHELTVIAVAAILLSLSSAICFAQDDVPQTSYIDTSSISKAEREKIESYKNEIAGEFTPGRGFNAIRTDFASLNISGYLLARYINQLPAKQTFRDHLGREQLIDPRNDIQVHRVFVWFTGFLGVERFRYNLTVWGLPTTQQVLVFGNLTYAASDAFKFGVGIAPNLGARSLQGMWPFFNGSDRQLTEESMRPGFTGSIWMTGQMLPRLNYNISVGNNISQLGVTGSQLTRDLTTSASLWWMPTTGEFGERGGMLDFENHKELATRFGISYTHARDDRFDPVSDSTSANTQTKLSDGMNYYDRGVLAEGVTVQRSNYDQGSIDVGFKYKGFHFQIDYFFRYLSKIAADGPLPLESIFDHGGQATISKMMIPKTLGAYISSSYIFDQFQRYPWEAIAGLSYYPVKSRSWRINGQLIYVDRSSASSYFGYYLAGLKGPIIGISTDILL